MTESINSIVSRQPVAPLYVNNDNEDVRQNGVITIKDASAKNIQIAYQLLASARKGETAPDSITQTLNVFLKEGIRLDASLINHIQTSIAINIKPLLSNPTLNLQFFSVSDNHTARLLGSDPTILAEDKKADIAETSTSPLPQLPKEDMDMFARLGIDMAVEENRNALETLKNDSDLNSKQILAGLKSRNLFERDTAIAQIKSYFLSIGVDTEKNSAQLSFKARLMKTAQMPEKSADDFIANTRILDLEDLNHKLQNNDISGFKAAVAKLDKQDAPQKKQPTEVKSTSDNAQEPDYFSLDDDTLRNKILNRQEALGKTGQDLTYNQVRDIVLKEQAEEYKQSHLTLADLDKTLAAKNLTRKHVPGDGNCLFHSVIISLLAKGQKSIPGIGKENNLPLPFANDNLAWSSLDNNVVKQYLRTNSTGNSNGPIDTEIGKAIQKFRDALNQKVKNFCDKHIGGDSELLKASSDENVKISMDNLNDAIKDMKTMGKMVSRDCLPFLATMLKRPVTVYVTGPAGQREPVTYDWDMEADRKIDSQPGDEIILHFGNYTEIAVNSDRNNMPDHFEPVIAK